MVKNTSFIIALASLGLSGCAAGSFGPAAHNENGAALMRSRNQVSGLAADTAYDRQRGGGAMQYWNKNSYRNDSDDRTQNRLAGPADADRPPSIDESSNAAATTPDREFKDFREFEAYRRFQKLPADSPEKQAFRDWRKWQSYKRWKQNNP